MEYWLQIFHNAHFLQPLPRHSEASTMTGISEWDLRYSLLDKHVTILDAEGERKKKINNHTTTIFTLDLKTEPTDLPILLFSNRYSSRSFLFVLITRFSVCKSIKKISLFAGVPHMIQVID